MGFEDDMNLDDNYFETESSDVDGGAFAEKPKKLSRKELREAKKKNAEKTADLPKKKKGLFSRRERLDDDDSLSGQHLFDPTQETRVSTPRERKSDYESMAPIRNDNSEFSYLFAPTDEYETEDDVYPDSSIYSDSNTARDLLGGLAYDEARDGDSHEYDKYFSDDAEVRPPSVFSFKKHDRNTDEHINSNVDSDITDTEPSFDNSVKVTPRPVVSSATTTNNDSFLPELRSDSVFSPKPQEITSEPPRYFEEPKSEESEDEYMPQDANDNNQEFMPYPASNMYAPYPPMQPMQPMMGYPMVMPNTAQPQGGFSYQAIPVPYPVPMPYPMYPQGYYPPYPQPYPPYGAPDYYGRYMPPAYPPYDDRYGQHYDGRRNPNGAHYDDRYDGYDRRRDPRNDRREEGRDSSRANDRYDSRDHRDYEYRERPSYPQPPYQPPYEQVDVRTEPVHEPVPEPIQSEPAPISTYSEPIYTPPTDPISLLTQTDYPSEIASEQPIMPSDNFSDTDFTFNQSGDTPSFEQDSSAEKGFAINEFALGDSDDFSSDSNESNPFKFDFESASDFSGDMTASQPDEEGKPKGGRFKKRR